MVSERTHNVLPPHVNSASLFMTHFPVYDSEKIVERKKEKREVERIGKAENEA